MPAMRRTAVARASEAAGSTRPQPVDGYRRLPGISPRRQLRRNQENNGSAVRANRPQRRSQASPVISSGDHCLPQTSRPIVADPCDQHRCRKILERGAHRLEDGALPGRAASPDVAAAQRRERTLDVGGSEHAARDRSEQLAACPVALRTSCLGAAGRRARPRRCGRARGLCRCRTGCGWWAPPHGCGGVRACRRSRPSNRAPRWAALAAWPRRAVRWRVLPARSWCRRCTRRSTRYERSPTSPTPGMRQVARHVDAAHAQRQVVA